MFTIASSWDHKPIAKRLTVDGDRIVADQTVWPTRMHFQRVRTTELDSAAKIYAFLCHHAERGDALIPTSRKDDAPLNGDKKGDDFERVAASVYVCEVDGAPFLDGITREDLIRDPEGVLDAQIRRYHSLPDTLSYVAVLSSSAGFSKKGEAIGLRYHLYLALHRPYQPHEIDYIDEIHQRTGDAALRACFDTSIRNLGQFLLVAPPIIDGGDPFKQRIFYSARENEQAAFRFPPEFETLEQAATMPTRGTSSALPRLNKDAFDSESYRSEAVQNWVARTRWRDSKMTWAEAYPLLVAEMETVGASADAWKRLGGEDLSEAARMWRQFKFRDGDRTGWCLPRYIEPAGSVDEAYGGMERELGRVLEAPGTYLFKVPLGAGKTQQIVERATRESRNAVIMSPSIERCEELQERLNAQEEKRRYFDRTGWEDFDAESEIGLPWMVWRGRQQPGMCARAEVAEAVHKAGGSVHKDLCGHGQDIKCPHFSKCPHASQYEAFGHVRWLVPSNTIVLDRRIGNEAEVVFIDEGVTNHLAGGTSFKLSTLLEPRQPRLDELSKRAHAALVDGDTETMSPRDFGLTRAEIAEALDLELSLKPVVMVSPAMDDDTIMQEVSRASGRWHPPLYAFWKQLLAEYDLDRDYVNSIHKYFARDLKEWKVRVGWQVEADFLNDQQVVAFFDATPNEMALRAHFPDLETIEFNAPNRNVHVAQVLNMSGRKNQFLARDERQKELDRAYRNREGLAKWLNGQPGYTVCILPKDVREFIEAEHEFPHVAFGHYGAVQGQDEWTFGNGVTMKGAEVDCLAQFGRSAPPTWDVEAIAMGHFWRGEKLVRVPVPESGIPWYDQREKAIAGGYAGYVLRHPDERVDSVARDIWHSSQLQAFGRGRATRRDKPLRVFIGHFLALDVEVAEALDERELMARHGDVLLLSPHEVERVFGYSGRFAEKIGRAANVKYWVREGQTQPYRAWVREGVDRDAAMAEIGALRWERMG